MSLNIWKGPTNALVLANNSPIMEYGDRVKLTDIYHGLWSVCNESLLPRGTYGTGVRAGWVINACNLKTLRGGIGELTYEWEAGGTGADQPLPTQETRLEPQELYPVVEQNPHFKVDGVFAIRSGDVTLAYASQHASTPIARAAAISQLAGNAASSDPAVATSGALGQDLATMLMKGECTYYQASFRFIWIWYTYTLPDYSHGGYIQTPSEAGAPFSAGLETISWLRLADSFEPAGVNGSMWKVTGTWLGGQDGYWDPLLYPTP